MPQDENTLGAIGRSLSAGLLTFSRRSVFGENLSLKAVGIATGKACEGQVFGGGRLQLGHRL